MSFMFHGSSLPQLKGAGFEAVVHTPRKPWNATDEVKSARPKGDILKSKNDDSIRSVEPVEILLFYLFNLKCHETMSFSLRADNLCVVRLLFRAISSARVDPTIITSCLPRVMAV